MFSTARWTPSSSASRSTPATNPVAYSRCHRNGGWTTTVRAPRSSARRHARGSFAHGSRPPTPPPPRGVEEGGRRVDRDQGNGVVPQEPLQARRFLADGVCPDHDLDPVVTEVG